MIVMIFRAAGMPNNGNELFAAPVESGLTQPPSQDAWLERYARVGGRPLESLDY
jgi:hypothetical protein